MDTETGEIKKFALDEFVPDNFKPISEIFGEGNIIKIEGTTWRVVKAYIQPGKPGRMTIRLRGMPGTEIRK